MVYKIYFYNVLAPVYFEFNGNKKNLRQYALTLFDAKDDEVESLIQLSKAQSEEMMSYPMLLRDRTAA